MLIQDEYADFYLIQSEFSNDSPHVVDYSIRKIELDGQPSISLLQNVSFSAADYQQNNDDQEEEGKCGHEDEISYDYFLPAKAHFVEVRGQTRKIYDLSFLNKGSNILLDVQLFARQIDALICLTDDSALHFVSKTVLETMATTLE